MSASIDANSAPITPPPMMATRAGSVVELEHVVGRQHPGAVEVEARQRTRVGAGGEHQVGALHLGPVGESHPVRGRVGDLAPLAEHGDLAPLQQGLEALGQPVDDLALAGLRAGQVERGDPGVDAEVGSPLDRAQHLGGLEKLLGRDATPVQAGPADPTLLHECDVEPRRRAVERGRVARRTATQDHDVELLGQDGHLLEFTGAAQERATRPSHAEPRHSSRRNPDFGHCVPEHSLDPFPTGLDQRRSGRSRVTGRAGSVPRRR